MKSITFTSYFFTNGNLYHTQIIVSPLLFRNKVLRQWSIKANRHWKMAGQSCVDQTCYRRDFISDLRWNRKTSSGQLSSALRSPVSLMFSKNTTRIQKEWSFPLWLYRAPTHFSPRNQVRTCEVQFRVCWTRFESRLYCRVWVCFSFHSVPPDKYFNNQYLLTLYFAFRTILAVNSDYFLKQPLTGWSL
jgi:hypothetical protein